GVVFAASALLAPPLAVFAPLGLAPLLAVVAVALLAAEGRRAVAAARPYAGFAALFLLVSLWAALSALWSPIPGHSLFEALRFLAIAAAGLVVAGSAAALGAHAARRSLRALLAGTALAILLLQLERHAGEPIAHWLSGLSPAEPLAIARYDRGVTVLLLLAVPGAAFLAQRQSWRLFALLAVAVAATISEFASHTAILAFAVAALTGAVASRWPRFVAAALVAGPLLIATLFPLLAPGGAAIAEIQRAVPMLPPSAIHRLAIWRFASDRIADRPVLGWGMDSARAIPGGRLPVIELYPQLRLSPLAQAMPLHPHDAALQWRLELGLPGLALLLALLALLLWRLAAARDAPWRTALAFAYAGAALTVALLSFGAWQAWWLSLVWLGAAFLLAGTREAAARAADP
ncbi:MAG TPA: O-antigen ligase family protein, partial [Stellaceae bacterium]|nr:O-antigen ligase family protein [Stellaceae bacterium]